jgi:hypothetical protein
MAMVSAILLWQAGVDLGYRPSFSRAILKDIVVLDIHSHKVIAKRRVTSMVVDMSQRHTTRCPTNQRRVAAEPL